MLPDFASHLNQGSRAHPPVDDQVKLDVAERLCPRVGDRLRVPSPSREVLLQKTRQMIPVELGLVGVRSQFRSLAWCRAVYKVIASTDSEGSKPADMYDLSAVYE